MFYVYDPMGNVAQRLDASGNVLSQDLYDAFGMRLNAGGDSDPYGWGAQWGYYMDQETGLVLMTHRHYDPATGRFLTRDPIGPAGGINLYAYVDNNPVNWIDPLGLKPGDKYGSSDAAAKDALRDILPTSISQDLEYAGRIYRNQDGTFSYTEPRKGEPHRSWPGRWPDDTTNEGYYHTHGADTPNVNDNCFSQADRNKADGENRPGYLGDPDGTIWRLDPGRKKGGLAGFLGQREPGKVTPIGRAPTR